MNEKPKKNRIFIIVGAVLLVWAISATGIGIFFYGKYRNIQSIVEAAGGSELAELVEYQRNTILELQADLNSAEYHIRAGLEYRNELEQRIGRAYEYAELTDAELIGFGDTMASSGNTLQAAIYLQQRTIEFVSRIERNNSAIKVELGVRP